MQIYYLLVIVIIIVTALSSGANKKTGAYVLSFSVLLLFLFSAFRIGFTPDYENYEIAFDNPEITAANERHRNEGLYQLMLGLLSYRMALIIQAALICLGLFFTIKNYVPLRYRSYCYLIFFFCTSFFLGNLSGYRSSFVTVALFFAIYLRCTTKRGWIFGLPLVIAASLIHQSGWLLVPLLFVPAKPLSPRRYTLLIFLSIVLISISLLGANVLNSLVFGAVEYFEEYETYMQAEISNTRTLGYFTVFRYLMLFFLFFYSLNSCKKQFSNNDGVFVKLTAVFFLIDLLPGIGLISRFSSYFAFISLAGFSIMLKNENNKALRALFIVAFILYGFWSFYLLALSPNFVRYFAVYQTILF